MLYPHANLINGIYFEYGSFAHNLVTVFCEVYICKLPEGSDRLLSRKDGYVLSKEQKLGLKILR